MVSSGVVALVIAALAQAVYSAPSCGCGYTLPAYEQGCCPGPVVEKKSVINKAFTVPYCYTEPTCSRQCYTRPAGVDRKVIPSAFETPSVCEQQKTVVKVPSTDVEVKEQPLCRKTCTTSEYVIQIPIVETTCTSAPLCHKTVRTQDNLLTTVSKKTACAKQVCTQNKVVDQPFSQTVCQNYQGAVTKTGAQTVFKPEVIKSCVQLPPRPCLKPATGPGTFVDYGSGAVPYPVDVYGPGYAGVDGIYGGAYGPYGPYGGYPVVGDVYGPGYAGVDGFYGGAYVGPYASYPVVGDVYGPGYAGVDGLYGGAYAAGPYYGGFYGPDSYYGGFYGAVPGPACSCAY